MPPQNERPEQQIASEKRSSQNAVNVGDNSSHGPPIAISTPLLPVSAAYKNAVAVNAQPDKGLRILNADSQAPRCVVKDKTEAEAQVESPQEHQAVAIACNNAATTEKVKEKALEPSIRNNTLKVVMVSPSSASKAWLKECFRSKDNGCTSHTVKRSSVTVDVLEWRPYSGSDVKCSIWDVNDAEVGPENSGLGANPVVQSLFFSSQTLYSCGSFPHSPGVESPRSRQAKGGRTSSTALVCFWSPS